MREGTGRASAFIRSNILGLIAIFIALSGTAAALPGKNKVDSGDIKNAQVKGKDLAANAVDSSKVADNALTGADIDEASLSGLGGNGGPSGPAGGDLAGTYPNPTVKESALDLGGELGGTAADATVDETALQLAGDLSGTVASATVNESALALGGDLSGTVANAQIQAGTVGATELNNNAVVGGAGGDVQDGSLTGADIQNDSLGPDDIDETNLNAATVNGHQVLSVTDGAAVNGLSLTFIMSTIPTNTTSVLIDSEADNSKVYAEMTGAGPVDRLFDGDLDAAEGFVFVDQSTAAATDAGRVTVRFQNGANGRVVTADLAWHTQYGSGVTAFGRVIG